MRHRGFKQSEITKEKIRKSLLGKKHSEERRKNNSKGHMGIYVPGTGFQKGCISNSPRCKKGHSVSDAERKKCSESRKGSKNWNWKGGITPLVMQIRHCFKYRQWISDVFTRDDFTCQLSGERGGRLEADHYPKSFSEIFHENNIKTLEEALECEEFWNINNGRTLCKNCHRPNKV